MDGKREMSSGFLVSPCNQTTLIFFFFFAITWQRFLCDFASIIWNIILAKNDHFSDELYGVVV